MDNKPFTLTKDHITLMKKFWVEWTDCETGAPGIDPKRPYGNSDVEGDICEILGWKMNGKDEDDEKCYSRKQREIAEAIHREMETALQIALTCYPATPGVYQKTDAYDATSWKQKK